MPKIITDVDIEELSLVVEREGNRLFRPANPLAKILATKSVSKPAGLFDKIVELFKGKKAMDAEKLLSDATENNARSAAYSALCSLGYQFTDAMSSVFYANDDAFDAEAKAEAAKSIMDTYLAELTKLMPALGYGEKAGARHSAADQEHLDEIKKAHGQADDAAAKLKDAHQAIADHLAALNDKKKDGDGPSADPKGRGTANETNTGTVKKDAKKSVLVSDDGGKSTFVVEIDANAPDEGAAITAAAKAHRVAGLPVNTHEPAPIPAPALTAADLEAAVERATKAQAVDVDAKIEAAVKAASTATAEAAKASADAALKARDEAHAVELKKLHEDVAAQKAITDRMIDGARRPAAQGAVPTRNLDGTFREDGGTAEPLKVDRATAKMGDVIKASLHGRVLVAGQTAS